MPVTVIDVASRTMDAPKKKGWIKKATSGAHGQFRAKAQAAGKTTRAFAKAKEHAPGKLGAEARLAENLMGLKHRGLYKKKG